MSLRSATDVVTEHDARGPAGAANLATCDDFLFVSLPRIASGEDHEEPAWRDGRRFSGAIDETGLGSAVLMEGQSLSAILPTEQYDANNALRIERGGKIGIGTWEIDGEGTARRDLKKVDFGWYYDWSIKPLRDSEGRRTESEDFVPMFWGRQDVTRKNRAIAEDSSSNYILGFNEPDHPDQADMSVAQALKLWPKLMSTGKLLGSPATTTGETLGEGSWLDEFMSRADRKEYDVDFIAVHYYSTDTSIAAFESFLREVHRAYDRPVWVTEWALVDWSNPGRFTADQLADFAHEATLMMDDLKFVERHAWFGAYAGGDGWYINSEVFDANSDLTSVGETFADLTM